jgi:hypothetical protein
VEDVGRDSCGCGAVGRQQWHGRILRIELWRTLRLRKLLEVVETRAEAMDAEGRGERQGKSLLLGGHGKEIERKKLLIGSLIRAQRRDLGPGIGEEMSHHVSVELRVARLDHVEIAIEEMEESVGVEEINLSAMKEMIDWFEEPHLRSEIEDPLVRQQHEIHLEEFVGRGVGK